MFFFKYSLAIHASSTKWRQLSPSFRLVFLCLFVLLFFHPLLFCGKSMTSRGSLQKKSSCYFIFFPDLFCFCQSHWWGLLRFNDPHNRPSAGIKTEWSTSFQKASLVNQFIHDLLWLVIQHAISICLHSLCIISEFILIWSDVVVLYFNYY